MNEKITIRIAALFTALILVLTAVTPAYAAGDTTIPTLTAVVNNGMLTVDATDDATGISAIYVNGFEFTDLTDGSLTIRMQQYDTGYQYFTMQAKDGAGNLSEVYRVNNPYYTFPDEDNGEEVEDPSLPTDANPTKPSNAEGEVTDHVKTDNHGNKTDRRSRSSSSTSSSSSSTKSSSSSTKSSSSSTKKSGVEEDEDDEDEMEVDSASKITSEGREFYTIMTKTGKVFYLVIDRTKDEETVHFLTDITENDLLNATEDNKPTLPQNSAVVIKDAGLADMSAGAGRDGEQPPEEEKAEENTVSEDSLLIDDTAIPGGEDQVSDNIAPKEGNIITDNLFIIIGCAAVFVIAIIVKLLKRNDRDAAFKEDEEDDDDEDYPDDPEEYPDEEEEDNNAFMDREDDNRDDAKDGTNEENDPGGSVITQPEIKTEKSDTEESADEAQEEQTEQPGDKQNEEKQPDDPTEEQAESKLPEQEEPEDKEQEKSREEDLQVSGKTYTDPDGMYTAKSNINGVSPKNTEETIYI